VVDDTIKVQPLDSDVVQKCAIHPKMNASGVCCECGAGVCVICKSGIGEKLYCPKCAGNDIQGPVRATNEPVQDKKIQRELDWLQDFEKQYEEVTGLVVEMQNIAKHLPSTSQESNMQDSSDIKDQFKELQLKFVNIEKSLGSGSKPKRPELQKMKLLLKDACMNYGIACVAYRKWAEKPSSSIEAYTNEKLGKAGKLMKEVDEQLVILSNEPNSKEKSEQIQAGIHRDTLTGIRRNPQRAVLIAFVLSILPFLVIGALVSHFSLSEVNVALIWFLLILYIITEVLLIYAFIWALKQRKLSRWWLLVVLFIPFGLLYVDLLLLSEDRYLTKEQRKSGLYIDRDGELLDVKRNGEVLQSFYAKATKPEFIREEAQKFVRDNSQYRSPE